MEKHLICLDLDGTLLTDDKKIGTYTKNVINTLKQYGHKIMITTGRPYRATVPYYKELKLNTPVVNFNGAFVHHPLDNDFKIKHETLSQEVLNDIVKNIEVFGIENIVAEVKDDLYIHYHDEVMMKEFYMGEPMIKTGDITKTMPEEATTVLIKAKHGQVSKIRQAMEDVYAEAIAHRQWDAAYPVVEIIKKGISKATGIEYVLDYLGVDHRNTIAFGDEDNDFQMIEYVNHSVAVKNAVDPLKERAVAVTEFTNNEDGVGRYLNEYFNLGLNYY
ncbi:Cof-type HAD-IIB family hydrolase [Phocicoccus pinnipedialis]|uniref:Sugar phosphatase YidA n=1 Tax=Phocicoccus pinnipedialis TaxID=110845 RepID=A0A6V7R8B1_9BACL|nr:Cof-type HAD-IIB family hydrolase [Jeotgalicoccus pinnipedialis]MBP1938906.1 Cof subfamily protein (haloacid dehalogenase superfamily) [Jeotgalicoccus pinnipedialis]CAD2073254.1 Sugar phosphatase YidA [Jeotgalicoccus pinnipedialis]